MKCHEAILLILKQKGAAVLHGQELICGPDELAAIKCRMTDLNIVTPALS